ncbi:hypothetical protein AVEN_6597-1 [Araneus ventricosus]|uniref:Uncharacterized protein n=1 Tax=Araneus ventricosus TaxID=182803 RepID=A0A4Y2JXX6_ARAVE|nr:hypothetical protein AVEN_6597-1 [Araneus ventricosus]
MSINFPPILQCLDEEKSRDELSRSHLQDKALLYTIVPVLRLRRDRFDLMNNPTLKPRKGYLRTCSANLSHGQMTKTTLEPAFYSPDFHVILT